MNPKKFEKFKAAMLEVYEALKKHGHVSLYLVARNNRLATTAFTSAIVECKIVKRSGSKKHPIYKWNLSGPAEPIMVRLCLAKYSELIKGYNKKYRSQEPAKPKGMAITDTMPSLKIRKVGFIRRQLFAVKNLILKIW